MKKTAYTPAPWSVEEDQDGKPPHRTQYYWISSTGKHAPVDHEWAILNRADAHMMAASPELYEALKRILPPAMQETIEKNHKADCACNYCAAVAAIAKAEGR